MPNYCKNTLSVRSDKFEEIELFFEDNKTFNNQDKNNDSLLSFSKSVPKPEDEEDWYNWNINNWGTKWDATDVGINNVSKNGIPLESTNELIYYFTTAWGPALTWLGTLAKKYPNLCFEYEYSESGNDLYGKVMYSNGEMTEDIEKELSEFNWEKVDKELLLQVIKEKIDIDHEDEIDDLVEEVVNEYANQDKYLENIHSYVENEINNYILNNSRTHTQTTLFGFDKQYTKDDTNREKDDKVEEDNDDRYVDCDNCETQVDCWNTNINCLYKGDKDKPTEEIIVCQTCCDDLIEEFKEEGYNCDDWQEEEEEEEVE
jgi:hypothetical protein